MVTRFECPICRMALEAEADVSGTQVLCPGCNTVIAVPAKAVPETMRECGEAGVAGAVIVSSGFKEIGREGKKLEEEICAIAESYGVRIVGPNCLGYIRPGMNLNVTFAHVIPPAGRVAFFSQSGALGTAILDWAAANHVGFSAFVSVGSMADVDFGDLIDYFGADSHTSSIILYIESITDARKFMSAARHFAKSKPIIVVKSGRTARSALAAASHTGALAGDDTLYSAVFRRAGVVRVDEIEDLFDASEALSRVSSPRGPRLGIVTNAGGPGVMASDRLLSLGGELAELTPETDAKLEAALPGFAARGNPVDVAGDADAARYATAAQALIDDPNCDGVLAILTPQAMSDPTATAQALVEVSRTHQLKPLLTSFMGEIAVADGVKIFRNAHVPTFDTPEDAVRAYMYMYQYTRNLANLYETPADILPDFSPDRDAVKKTFIEVARDGRSILSEVEALADRVSIIRDGRRVEVGSLAEMRHLARLSISADLAATPDGLSTVPGVHDLRVDGGHVDFLVDPGSLDQVLRTLTAVGVTSLTSRPPTLEELFLRHYGDGQPAAYPEEAATP